MHVALKAVRVARAWSAHDAKLRFRSDPLTTNTRQGLGFCRSACTLGFRASIERNPTANSFSYVCLSSFIVSTCITAFGCGSIFQPLMHFVGFSIFSLKCIYMHSFLDISRNHSPSYICIIESRFKRSHNHLQVSWSSKCLRCLSFQRR